LVPWKHKNDRVLLYQRGNHKDDLSFEIDGHPLKIWLRTTEIFWLFFLKSINLNFKKQSGVAIFYSMISSTN
jgi:hypothetical protein